MTKLFSITTLVVSLFALTLTLGHAEVAMDNYSFSKGVTLDGVTIAVAGPSSVVEPLQVSAIWSEQDEIGASCKETGDKCKKDSECCSGLTCSGSSGKNYCY